MELGHLADTLGTDTLNRIADRDIPDHVLLIDSAYDDEGRNPWEVDLLHDKETRLWLVLARDDNLDALDAFITDAEARLYYDSFVEFYTGNGEVL